MKKFVLMVMLMAPIAVFAQKFGKVNTQAIMQSLPELSKVNGELEAAAKQYENELKSMQEELQRQSEAYEKAKSTMSQTDTAAEGAGTADSLSEDSADLPGQPAGFAEDSAGEDAASHHKGSQRYSECWQCRWLYLYL